jgi:hypothetical protein
MQVFAQLGAIVGLVAEHPFRRLHSANEALCERAIVRFTSGQQDGDKAPFNICECVNLRIAPSARAANSLLLFPPFPPAAERCAFTCVESIICVSVDRPFPASSRNRFSQTPRPAHKAVIDRCRRTIVGRAIAPATAALQHVHDAADDAAIVHPFDALDIRRQVRFDTLPLRIAQPKQVPAHDPNPLPKTNQDRIVRAEKLMSSDPSQSVPNSGSTSQEVEKSCRPRCRHKARNWYICTSISLFPVPFLNR